MKTVIYKDVEFEEKTKKDLQASLPAMQKVLTEWLDLKLGPCMGLNDLVLRPRAVYDKAVNDLIKVPEPAGPFRIDPTQYRGQLVLPDPSGLYAACKEALRFPFTAMNIFIVADDKVELDADAVAELIDSRTIYATDPDKVKLAAVFNEYVSVTNKLNEMLQGDLLPTLPTTHLFFRNKFILSEKLTGESYIFNIGVDTDFLRSKL